MLEAVIAGYADAAPLYRAAGWHGVLPLPPDAKLPPPEGFTGASGGWPDDRQIDRWRKAHPDGNVALRLGRPVIGIDGDVYRKPDTWRELEAMLGVALPSTWTSTSRTDGSGIRLYRVPPAPKGRRWKSAPVPGVEIVRFEHRFALVWPSIHPEGRLYIWLEPTGALAEDDRVPEPDDLTFLPLAAVERLLEDDAELVAREAVAFGLTGGAPSTTVKRLLERGLDVCANGDGASRHDGTLPVVLRLVRAAEQGEPGVEPALEELHHAFVAAVGPDRPGGQRQAEREFGDMLTGAHARVATTEPPTPRPGERARDAQPDVAPALGDDFWTKRESLKHLRSAAWSQGRSPESVLGAALARAVADTNYRAVLDTAVGAPCGLSLLVAILGPPGTGKSSSSHIAVRLMPRKLLSPDTDDVPPGSGEGLVELLFGNVKETSDDGKNGKTVTERRQVHNHCFVYCDEAEVLVRQANRASASTILPVMRTIFTGGTLGQANATKDRYRVVPGGRYVYGIVLGLQPDRAGALFDDAGAGTPQRMLWVPTQTQTPIPKPGERPDWPGALKWGPAPSVLAVNNVIDVDAAVLEEVRHNDHDRQTHGCDPLDEHHDLIRLKVGTALALLDQRADLSREDWALAGEVTDLSRDVRAAAIRRVDELGATQEHAHRKKLAGRALAADDAVRARRVVDTARAIAERTHEAGAWTVREARHAVRREPEIFDAALAHALAEQWVLETEEPSHTGDPKRVLRPRPNRPR